MGRTHNVWGRTRQGSPPTKEGHRPRPILRGRGRRLFAAGGMFAAGGRRRNVAGKAGVTGERVGEWNREELLFAVSLVGAR